METKGIIGAAVITAVGMIIMGMSIANGIVAFKDRDRTVVVKGLS